MKKIIIALCTFIFLCMSVFAAEQKRWIDIFDDDAKIMSFDAQTISQNEEGNILVWEKMIIKQPSKNLKIGNEFIYKYLALNEYKKGFVRTKSRTFFDKNDKILMSQTQNEQWDVILPDTWQEQIFPIYCQVVQKLNKKS